jgi:hypothetical protein
MLLKKFRVVKCLSCYLFQVTGSSKSLKCLRCGKTKVISSLKIYFKSESAKECQLVLAELKKREFSEKEENHDDFFSYDNSKNSSLNKKNKSCDVVSSEELDELFDI